MEPPRGDDADKPPQLQAVFHRCENPYLHGARMGKIVTMREDKIWRQ